MYSNNWPTLYCATPSRLFRFDPEINNKIMEFSISRGFAPFLPFQAYPFDYFEGGK
jgi:hypothetical protein